MHCFLADQPVQRQVENTNPAGKGQSHALLRLSHPDLLSNSAAFLEEAGLSHSVKLALLPEAILNKVLFVHDVFFTLGDNRVRESQHH